MNFEIEGLVLFFTVALEQAEKTCQELIDENAKTPEERRENDAQIYAAVSQGLKTRLRELGPARLDIFSRSNCPRERVIDGSDGLWIIALSMQEYSMHETVTGNPISAILAVKMTDGVAKFEDFICAVIFDHDKGQDERVVVIEKSTARYADGRMFRAYPEVDDPKIDEVFVDDDTRKKTGVIFASYLTVTTEWMNHLSGGLNSAEALFVYALFKAVGGTVIDQEGRDASRQFIRDSQWLRASVVAE